MIKDENLFEFR